MKKEITMQEMKDELMDYIINRDSAEMITDKQLNTLYRFYHHSNAINNPNLNALCSNIDFDKFVEIYRELEADFCEQVEDAKD